MRLIKGYKSLYRYAGLYASVFTMMQAVLTFLFSLIFGLCFFLNCGAKGGMFMHCTYLMYFQTVSYPFLNFIHPIYFFMIMMIMLGTSGYKFYISYKLMKVFRKWSNRKSIDRIERVWTSSIFLISVADLAAAIVFTTEYQVVSETKMYMCFQNNLEFSLKSQFGDEFFINKKRLLDEINYTLMNHNISKEDNNTSSYHFDVVKLFENFIYDYDTDIDQNIIDIEPFKKRSDDIISIEPFKRKSVRKRYSQIEDKIDFKRFIGFDDLLKGELADLKQNNKKESFRYVQISSTENNIPQRNKKIDQSTHEVNLQDVTINYKKPEQPISSFNITSNIFNIFNNHELVAETHEELENTYPTTKTTISETNLLKDYEEFIHNLKEFLSNKYNATEKNYKFKNEPKKKNKTVPEEIFKLNSKNNNEDFKINFKLKHKNNKESSKSPIRDLKTEKVSNISNENTNIELEYDDMSFIDDTLFMKSIEEFVRNYTLSKNKNIHLVKNQKDILEIKIINLKDNNKKSETIPTKNIKLYLGKTEDLTENFTVSTTEIESNIDQKYLDSEYFDTRDIEFKEIADKSQISNTEKDYQNITKTTKTFVTFNEIMQDAELNTEKIALEDFDNINISNQSKNYTAIDYEDILHNFTLNIKNNQNISSNHDILNSFNLFLPKNSKNTQKDRKDDEYQVNEYELTKNLKEKIYVNDNTTWSEDKNNHFIRDYKNRLKFKVNNVKESATKKLLNDSKNSNETFLNIQLAKQSENDYSTNKNENTTKSENFNYRNINNFNKYLEIRDMVTLAQDANPITEIYTKIDSLKYNNNTTTSNIFINFNILKKYEQYLNLTDVKLLRETEYMKYFIKFLHDYDNNSKWTDNEFNLIKKIDNLFRNKIKATKKQKAPETIKEKFEEIVSKTNRTKLSDNIEVNNFITSFEDYLNNKDKITKNVTARELTDIEWKNEYINFIQSFQEFVVNKLLKDSKTSIRLDKNELKLKTKSEIDSSTTKFHSKGQNEPPQNIPVRNDKKDYIFLDSVTEMRRTGITTTQLNNEKDYLFSNNSQNINDTRFSSILEELPSILLKNDTQKLDKKLNISIKSNINLDVNIFDDSKHLNALRKRIKTKKPETKFTDIKDAFGIDDYEDSSYRKNETKIKDHKSEETDDWNKEIKIKKKIYSNHFIPDVKPKYYHAYSCTERTEFINCGEGKIKIINAKYSNFKNIEDCLNTFEMSGPCTEKDISIPYKQRCEGQNSCWIEYKYDSTRGFCIISARYIDITYYCEPLRKTLIPTTLNTTTLTKTIPSSNTIITDSITAITSFTSSTSINIITHNLPQTPAGTDSTTETTTPMNISNEQIKPEINAETMSSDITTTKAIKKPRYKKILGLRSNLRPKKTEKPFRRLGINPRQFAQFALPFQNTEKNSLKRYLKPEMVDEICNLCGDWILVASAMFVFISLNTGAMWFLNILIAFCLIYLGRVSRRTPSHMLQAEYG